MFNTENLLNFVTAMIFEESLIYNTLFRLLSCLYKSEESVLVEKINKVKFTNKNLISK